MLHLARVSKASPWAVLTKIRFPCALPSLFAGMKVAISFALVGAIVGEFVAGSRGIGFQILVAQGQFDTVQGVRVAAAARPGRNGVVLSGRLRRTAVVALARLAARAPRTIRRARMKDSQPSLGTLALIATAALWGSNHVVARAAREAVPLPALAFWRWLPAAAILTVIALPAMRQAWPAIRARFTGLVVGGAIGVGLFSYFLLGGAYQSLAIEVGFINATTPVWVLLLGRWMGEGHLTAGVKWGVALAFAGTLLIISKGQPQTLTELKFSLGNLWSLLAAISFAWFSIRIRDWSRTIAPLPLMVVTGWSGLIVVIGARLSRLDR